MVLDEEAARIEVVVPDDQLSLAIGRRGQNVRLASQLTGWNIDILTEAEESERRSEEFRTRSQMFIDALDVDDVIAHLLVTEGFTKIEEVAFVPVEELAGDRRLRRGRGRASCASAPAPISQEQNEKLNVKRRELGVSRRARRDRRADPGDAGDARRERREDAATISPISPATS